MNPPKNLRGGSFDFMNLRDLRIFSDRLKNTQANHFSQWPAFAGGKVWCFRDPSASEDRREHPGTHHLCVASTIKRLNCV